MLLVCALALFGVMILVLVDRYRLERLRHEADELRMAVETRRADLDISLFEGREA